MNGVLFCMFSGICAIAIKIIPNRNRPTILARNFKCTTLKGEV